MPYLEEFLPGQVISTPARTIHMHDITNFAYMSADWHPLHTDAEFARDSSYGGLVAHGPFVLVAAYGLMARAGLFDRQAIGFLGLKWEMKQPVRPGDTIRVEVTVQGSRKSRTKPDRGVVDLSFLVRNQHDTLVATGEWKNMPTRLRAAGNDLPTPNTVAALSELDDSESAPKSGTSLVGDVSQLLPSSWRVGTERRLRGKGGPPGTKGRRYPPFCQEGCVVSGLRFDTKTPIQPCEEIL